MKREVNNTRKCIDCGAPVPRKVKRCPSCNQAFLKARPTYERTPEHRAKMSAALTGKTHNWSSASTRSEVAEKIRDWWTPERRERARLRGEMLAENRQWRDMIAASVAGEKNPNYQDKDNATGYAPGWGRLHRHLIRERAGGKCEVCGREGRLDIHHRDFSKDNHDPENLQVLCRRCHKLDHSSRNHQD